MKRLGATIERIDERRPVVLAELHPELRDRVEAVLAELGSRFTPWCGYRGPEEQAKAKRLGNSGADFGQSPHNFTPALACDVVLDPRFVELRAAPGDPRYPDLWDDASPEAIAAWEALEAAAVRHGLERVNVHGKRDKPHLQLAGWRALIPH